MGPEIDLITKLSNVGGLFAGFAAVFYVSVWMMRSFRAELAQERERCDSSFEKQQKLFQEALEKIVEKISDRIENIEKTVLSNSDKLDRTERNTERNMDRK